MHKPIGAFVLGALSFLTEGAAAKSLRSSATNASYGTPVASVANGTYVGRHSPEYGQDFFLGVPFAQPPTGQLRFAAPQPLNHSFDRVRNATQYGPECIGYGFDQWILGNYVSEDCLTVNVVRPEGISDKDSLPVAVWIHGGVSLIVLKE